MLYLSKMNKSILSLFLVLGILSCASAQKANKQLDEIAEDAYKTAYGNADKPEGDFVKALEILQKGLRKDSSYAKLWQYKAGIEYDMKNYKASNYSYKKLTELEPDNYSNYYFYGLSNMALQQFDEAEASFKTYLNGNMRRSKDYENNAKKILGNLGIIRKLYASPVPFNPMNLGPNVNTANGEYWPGMTLDGKFFYFTRMMEGKRGFYEDFYVSDVKDTVCGPSQKMPAPINTEGNEGTISISADGKSIFFSSSTREGQNGLPIGQGSFDLYFSRYNNGQWSFPANLGPVVNSASWESQPSISPDGLTLYFSSNRPGGYGGADIWKTVFRDGRFTLPENLGAAVNTAGEEQAPFIHYDGKTLFFSSNGHVGAGGLDIYVAKMNDSGKFVNVANVGVPINSEKDELGLVVDRLGKFGYLSSERPGGFGGLDIYRFELPASLKPEPVSYVKGYVYDDKTKEPLVAKIELTDLSTGKVINSISSMKDGNFFIVLKSNTDYMMTIDQVNYLFYSANFSLKEHGALEPYQLDVPLKKPEVNTEVVLNNVFFDVDKYDLKPESMLELDKLVQLMRKFPFMKIEIGGHTDNTGDPAKNKTLSMNRAKAVKAYLVSKGIDATRLTAVGYGDSLPIADNKTDQGKAQNRRTVFKVMSIN